MANNNQITLVGKTVRDAELRFTPSGVALCQFSIAVNERWGEGDNKKEKTHFVDVKCWRGVAEASSELKKGEPVVVIGSIDQESWEDKTTKQKRSKLVVVANTVARPLFKSQGAKQAAPVESEAPIEPTSVPF